MIQCLALHDVYSQPQQSSRQRREEILNERRAYDATHGYSDIEGDDMPKPHVPEPEENEEVYRVNLDDDIHIDFNDTLRASTGRSEERSRRGNNSQSSGRRGSSSHSTVKRGSGSNRSTANLRRHSFETTIQDTFTGFQEFQRQSLQQLRLGGFEQDDYDKFKKAEAIFCALNLPKNTPFYWTCLNTLKEMVFWRKYFIDIG
ncbi:unnamed protein product [Microthlaspi erraticum]|uniref:Uncharacterized protein n=1 Tax=Microthlaspi erraticum TaxID=1685480 RepID=A0A6D2HQ39_9BRAS|nr:unnamed protein product [Microthlaspi erraticum]